MTPEKAGPINQPAPAAAINRPVPAAPRSEPAATAGATVHRIAKLRPKSARPAMSIQRPVASPCTTSESGSNAALARSNLRDPIRPANRPIGTEAASVTIVAAESSAPVWAPERLNRSWSVGRTGSSAESATAFANASAETAKSARSARRRVWSDLIMSLFRIGSADR